MASSSEALLYDLWQTEPPDSAGCGVRGWGLISPDSNSLFTSASCQASLLSAHSQFSLHWKFWELCPLEWCHCSSPIGDFAL